MTTPWIVSPEWRGETVAILASGPSMTREVAESVRGRCSVIAVSNQGIDNFVGGRTIPAFAPWADILYSADMQWWMHHEKEAKQFAGRKVTVRDTLRFPWVHSLQESRQKVFDERPSHLATGANSGYQAVHLAVHLGAARILMCGFDMRDVKGQQHWFGGHPSTLNRCNAYSVWIDAFEKLAVYLKKKPVKMINCTPDSALKGLESMPLDEALSATRVRTDPPAARLSA